MGLGSGVEDPAGATDRAQALRRGGVALVVNGGLIAALGVTYWVVAARVFRPADVGRGAALVSALWTVSGLAQLNYARSLSRLLPGAQSSARKFLMTVYVRVSLTGCVLGVAAATLAPLISRRLAYVHSHPLFILAFAVAVPVWSIFTLEDGVLATVRRAVVIPFENTTYGAAQLALLVVLGRRASAPRTAWSSFCRPYSRSPR